MNPSKTLILGVDGGGSNTTAWLAEIDDQNSVHILGRGKSAASNCHAVGSDQSLHHLDDSITAAFADANQARSQVAAACFAMAGADRHAEQQIFQNWVDQNRLTENFLISNDALPVIYAADKEGMGIGLIAGTGSLCIGRSIDGITRRCGGWGSLFGDEGSGFGIAIEGLRAAARHEDQRGPSTKIHRAMVNRLEVKDLSQAIPRLYASGTTRAEIASLAKIVFDAAREEDSVAIEIIDRAATSLAELVFTVGGHLHHNQPSWNLAISGGVLIHQPDFARQITNQVETVSGNAINLVTVKDPVLGAINMARQRFHL